MYLHPAMASQLAAEKRRDMLAQAKQDSLAKQLSDVARASRRAQRAERKLQKAERLALRLRSELAQ